MGISVLPAEQHQIIEKRDPSDWRHSSDSNSDILFPGTGSTQTTKENPHQVEL